MRIKKTFKKVARKSRRAFVKKSVKPSKSLVKVVQKIIHKDAETKQAYTSLATTAFNSGITSTGDIIQVLPNIAQGSADNQRIGDQLRGQSLIIKGAIVGNPSTGSYGTFANSRLGVRVFVVQPRNLSDLTSVQASASWLNQLLKKGGTTVAFTGVISDLWATLNTDDIIKYYDKVHYITMPYQSTALGSAVMSGSTKILNIPIRMRNKLLKYDNGISSGITPTNFAPVMLIGYAHMDASSPDSLTTAINCQFDYIFNYEDV